jgi:hypothetical protein
MERKVGEGSQQGQEQQGEEQIPLTKLRANIAEAMKARPAANHRFVALVATGYSVAHLPSLAFPFLTRLCAYACVRACGVRVSLVRLRRCTACTLRCSRQRSDG